MTSTTSNKPTHRIYAVSKRAGDNSNWTEIGAAWPHKDGKGFNLKLEYLPLNGGELVLRVPSEKTKSDGSAQTTPAAEGGV